MQTLFSTVGLPPQDSVRRWREIISDPLMTVELRTLQAKPFAAKRERAEVGSLVVVDRQPLVVMTETDSRRILDVPRDRLERGSDRPGSTRP